ncbi:MAG: hypothetical protein FJ276_12625 [Planctomycetes bacterium]|nr:hypothetical protein [Planctomycetota bacterium]
MAKKTKTAKPKATPAKATPAPAAAAPEAPKGTKTAAIKAALKAHPKKQSKEIAELLQAEGWEISALYVSAIKSTMKKKRKKASPSPSSEAAPALPKDAVSVSSLRKAKKLVAELGGIKQAKTAVDALAQLLD